MNIQFGYDIEYECPQPTPMIMTLTVHSSRVSDLLTQDYVRTEPGLPLSSYRDDFGNWITRLVLPEGKSRVFTDALINDEELLLQVWQERQPELVEVCPSHLLVATEAEAQAALAASQAASEAASPGPTESSDGPTTPVDESARPPEDAAEPTASTEDSSDVETPAAVPVEVRRALLAGDVVDGEPVEVLPEVVTLPPEGERLVYFYMELDGTTGEAVTHRWLNAGGIEEEQALESPGDGNVRAYTARRISADRAGEWRVEALGADGRLLAVLDFRVEVDDEAAATLADETTAEEDPVQR